MMRWKFLIAAILAGCVCPTSFAAPPSSLNPDGYLPLFRGPSGKPNKIPGAILRTLQKEVPAEAKKVEQMRKVLDGAKFKQLNLKDVGITYVKLKRLLRGVDHLMMWGEPSAVGYKLQLEELIQKHGALIAKVKKDPYFQAKLKRNSSRFKLLVRTGVRSLTTHIDPLIEKGKIDNAHVRFNKLWDLIDAEMVFYDQRVYAKDQKEFDDRSKKIDAVVLPNRGRAVRAVLGKIRKQRLPAYDKLWRYAEDLVLRVKNDEPTEPGPAILTKFAKGWRDAQIGGMQCHALDLMIAGSFKSSSKDKDDKAEWQSKKQRLVEDHNNFTKKMEDAVVALIEADALRSSPEDVEKLYPQYLDATSLLIALHSDDTFRDRIEAALKKLLEKSDRLAQNVAAYDAATRRILFWRRKVAEAKSVSAQQTYSALGDTFLRFATRSTEKGERLVGDEKKGPANNKSSQLALQTFGRVPTNYLTSQMINKKVFAHDGIGLRMNNMQPTYPLKTRLNDRYYAGFTGKGPWIASEITSLESDLLIDAERPVPLTLEAQLAIASARRGDILEAGGRVSALMLESLVTRQASLSPSDWGMVRIGVLPTIGETGLDLFKQVQVRFVLSPHWLRHEYFFVELPDAAAKQ